MKTIVMVVPIAEIGFEYNPLSIIDKRRHQVGATPNVKLGVRGLLDTINYQLNAL